MLWGDDTEPFLARVSPASEQGAGYLNIHWSMPNNTGKGPPKWWTSKAYKTPKEAASFVQWLHQRQNQNDMYFCTSLQAQTTRNAKGKEIALREINNTLGSKVLFLDIDVKDPPKGYADLAEAKRELGNFLKHWGLPFPTILVGSGGGLHVYWVSHRVLTPAEWKPLAESLRAAAVHFGLRCDGQCTVDITRILRIPDTYNHKTTPPNPVKLIRMEEHDLDFEQHLIPALSKVPALSQLPAAVTSTASPATPTQPLFDPAVFKKRAVPSEFQYAVGAAGSVEHGEVPLDVKAVFKACGFMGQALATGGVHHSQTEWNIAVLATTFLGAAGRKTAHALGNRHPGYSPDTTDELYDRKEREKLAKDMGWPSCVAIEQAGSPQCATCPLRGTIRSPLNAGMVKTSAPAVAALNLQSATLQNAAMTVTFRDLNKDGRPKPSLANAVIAIRTVGIKASYNVFQYRINVTYNGQSKTIREGLLTDDTVSATRSLINNTYEIDCGDSNTLAAIKEISFDNAYDPVIDLLDHCQATWDGRTRLDTWVIDYLGCEDTTLNRAIGRKVLIAAARRARQPGCKFDTITVLENVEGTNKSTAIRVLAGDDYFSDQSIIGANDKEVQEQLQGVWMHENADLAGMKRAEVEQVKAFASRQVDRARPAYGRVREDRPRRSIEWGTTNNDEYLQSQTGNRRFWPLKTGKIDIEALKRDRQQLLGEAASSEAAGERITLDESLWGDVREAQERRRVKDPWEDHVANMPASIIHTSGDGYERVASADILTAVIGLPQAQQNSGHAQRLAYAMAHAGWGRNPTGRVTIGGKGVRGYVRRQAARVGASQKMPPFTQTFIAKSREQEMPLHSSPTRQSLNVRTEGEASIFAASEAARAANSAHEKSSLAPEVVNLTKE